MNKSKILAIVGPTASGKTALAIELAKRFDGEVISADSRQVYKGLNIGSGKVTTTEMAGVPHHLLDVADPKTTYTGHDFVIDASQTIKEIIDRNKLPIIAGGTFFYIDLLKGKNTSAPVAPNHTLRTELEKLSTEELFNKLLSLDVERAQNIDKNNRRRLIRSLEIIEILGKVPETEKKESDYDWLTIGINIDKETMKDRITSRIDERFKIGMIEEVEELLKNGITPERLFSFGLEYRYINEYLQNKITYEEMRNLLITKTIQFAKRQYTWLKKDEEIAWFDFPVTLNKVETMVDNFLQNTLSTK